MSSDEKYAPPPLSVIDLQCPDCTAVIDVPSADSSGRSVGDPSASFPTAPRDERILRGVDVQCGRCGKELGVYYLP